MASRSNVSRGVTIAQLDGRARYLLTNHVPHDQALEQLREIGAPADAIREAADRTRRYFAGHHPIQEAQANTVADLLEKLL